MSVIIDGISYTLDDVALTAIVDIGNRNCQLNTVIIPDKVTNNGIIYDVVKIEPNAFKRNTCILI
jgi:hypothetical protein